MYKNISFKAYKPKNYVIVMMRYENFENSPEIVAKELLGNVIARKIDGEIRKGIIVETEAYFGSDDPASRARQDGDLKKTMEMDKGTILVYGVHNSWLLNFVTESEGKASAVLIRAIEPVNFDIDTKGPGKLTKALDIDKRFHKQNILNNEEFWVEYPEKENDVEIVEKFRIGVAKDLEVPMRFYIKDNKHVSKK